MTRYISGELEPVISARKEPKAATIPPFSFTGELEIGISGYWYPTANMELQKASISASSPGTETASLNILKQELGVADPLVIGTFTLAANQVKQVISLNSTFVTPYDKIFIASWADSGHNGTVIQIVGTLMI